ncbi:lantibiotic dehydratase [Streptomyces jumonjinensis]|uniref:lantibiotic dehydratase n=1 Tax=Streptomyces jumonjinensis TaxID=1945 RepID=UPI0033321C9A
MVRSVPHATLDVPSWPDLTGSDDERARQQVDWLRQVWVSSDIAVAISHASPELARQVKGLCSADLPRAREARRATLSVARYLLRMTGRPTPTGLLAGVFPAVFGADPYLHWGSEHRAVARADAGWLATVADQAEGSPGALEQLLVVTNSTLLVRGDRVIVPYRLLPGDRAKAAEVSLLNTAPVQVALESARAPIRYKDLSEKIGASFPTASAKSVVKLLIELVMHRALITSVHAPGTEPDALGHLLGRLMRDGALELTPFTDLLEIHRLLELHHRVPAREARNIRAEAAVRMRRLARSRRHPVALDLMLDADAVLPTEVAREAEHAALLLARLSSAPHGTHMWQDYHRRFYERFGTGSLVPVLDVVADSGIGWPAGYPGTQESEPRPERTRRDERLLSLAQAAALDGRREIVLDQALLADLTPDSKGEARLPSHLELCGRLYASDLEAIQLGEFWLAVTSVSRASGVLTGRFLGALDPKSRDQFVSDLADLPGSDPETVCAQLSFPPLDPATAHVTRTVRTLPTVITLAEHRDTAPSDVLTVEDLAVGCDGHRLYLAAPALGKRVEAWGMHALNLRRHTPPLARFLTELSRAGCVQVTDFDWGAATGLPFLPRLRSGRVVLSPARWRLNSSELPERAAPWTAWDTALSEWRSRRRLPRSVHLADGDGRLPLDLDETGHRVLLREHLLAHHNAVLEEAPSSADTGWCEGRAHEIVIPLCVRQSAGWPPLPRPTTKRIVRRDHGHAPGVSPVLFAKLYGDGQRQNEILARRLPDLFSLWGEDQPTWWFIRFREGRDDSIRLRIALPDAGQTAFAEAARRVSDWADGLCKARLLREVAYATSHPETGRWGSGEALSAAETVFAADSRAVLVQLGQTARPHPQALAAAHFTAITTAFAGSVETGMEWLLNHVPATSTATVPRPVFSQAVRLADPRSGFRALRRTPGGASIVGAWSERSAALAGYRAHLPGPGTEGIDPDAALGSLLHTHFLRAYGIDPEAKSACLYLARAAALAFTARERGRS